MSIDALHLTAAESAQALVTAVTSGPSTPTAAVVLINRYTVQYTAGLATIARSMWADPQDASAEDVLCWLETVAQVCDVASNVEIDHLADQLLGAGTRFTRRYSCTGDPARGSVQSFPRRIALDIVRHAVRDRDSITRQTDGALLIIGRDTGHQQLLAAAADTQEA